MSQKKLLIIGLQYPEPKSTAAGSRMLQIIQLIHFYGFQIHFATTSPKNEFSFNLDDLDIQTHQLELNNSKVSYIFEAIHPDIVLFDRFITEEQFGWHIDESCPTAFKVLDTEDLHFWREAREQSIKASSESANSHELSDKAKRELASIYRCDLTLMISLVEIDLLVNKFNIPKNLLFYLPFVYHTTKLPANSDNYTERQNFMSIGNFKHKPNLDMVKHLYKAIWPKIRKELTNAEWHIYGAYLPEQIKQMHQPQKGILVKGRAEEVLSTMSSYKVMLAPLRFGAGLKGKCLDAMRAGTPSVTTAIGAEGIATAKEWSGFIAEHPQMFAKKAVELYQNERLWALKQQQGFDLLQHYFDIKVFSKDFQVAIAEGVEQLETKRQQNIVGELLKHHQHRSTKFMSLWIEEKNK